MSSTRTTRVTKSCSECQRRKQKCSREWPCNHCRARKIPHQCNFGTLKPSSEQSVAQPVVDELADGESKDFDGADASIIDEFGVTMNLHRTSLYDVPLRSTGPYDKLQKETMRNVVDTLPPRPILDMLVQDFVVRSNYNYYVLHPLTLLEHYVQWWYAKDHGLRLDPAFTCLILRVCAYASLYVQPDLQRHIESELDVEVSTLADQLHEGAQRLSMTISPGKGGLMQVQQLFLTCLWLKAQAMFVDSWHCLGAAVREAQELDMHQVSPPDKFSDFESETRVRVWWLLYSWDWQMSRGVSRPLLIDQDNCTVRRPTLSVDDLDSAPGRPSPFTHMALQGGLVQDLATNFDRLDGNFDAAHVIEYMRQVDDWFARLPACFRFKHPDTTWDESCPYIVAQRWQTNIQGYLIRFLPLKSYLKKPYTLESSMQDLALRAEAIECCLSVLEVSHDKLDELLPRIPKQHVATFAIFDIAIFLCSAVMHDRLASLPQSSRVFEAVRQSVRTMDRLKDVTSLGPKPYQILKRLAERLSVIPADTYDDGRASKRSRIDELGEAPATDFVEQVEIQEITNLADLSSQAAELQLWQDALHGTFDFDEDFDPAAFFSGGA